MAQKNTRHLGCLLALLVAAGCHGGLRQPVLVESDASTPGYRMAVEAMGCWLGGLWSDAEGYIAPRRHQIIMWHCRNASRMAFGDTGQAQALRAMEPALVEQVADKAG